MKIKLPYQLRALFFLLFIPLLFNFSTGGCGSNNEPPPENPPGPTGTMSVTLTDSSAPGTIDLQTASGPDAQKVFVTVARVEAHASADADNDSSGWILISEPNKTINLMDLANAQSELSLTDVPVGTYQQLRLILSDQPDSADHPFANYFIDSNNVTHELTVASGFKSGIKLVGSFTIVEGGTTTLLLDFDCQRSIVIAGASGKYLLKPVIKIVSEISFIATINGQVTSTDTQQAIAGALISVQNPNDLSVVTTTTADASGNFSLVVAPGTYRLVASAEGFETLAGDITIAAGETKTVDFALVPSTSNGTLHITLNIPDFDLDIFATFSIRATVNLQAGGTAEVEVNSVCLGDGGTIDINLPDGDFSVVASVNTFANISLDATINANATTDLDFSF